MHKGALILVAAVLLSGQVVYGQEKTEDVNASIQALKAELKQQQEKLENLEAKTSREELTKAIAKIKGDGGVPTWLDWLEGVKVSGDIRMRYEGQFRDTATRNGKDQHRGRFRFRIGAKKMVVDDQVELGFRIATGGGTTSTNQSFDTNFSGKGLFIDRVYAKFTPNSAKGLTVVGGKMANPLVGTDLIWDSDLNPEGVWAQFKQAGEGFSPFVSGGYFIVDEDNRTVASPHDTTLFSGQVGFEASPATDVTWTAAATYYDVDVHAGSTGAGFVASAMPRNYKLINVTNKVKFKIAGQAVGTYFDWVHNCGNDDVRARFKDKDNGFAVGVGVGKNKKKGDVSVKYKYAYIEPNCTVPGWADSDFGLGTGTNAKGHKVSVAYNVADVWTIEAAVFRTSAIVGSTNTDNTMVQLDSVWKW